MCKVACKLACHCRPCAGIRATSVSRIVGLTQAPARIDVDTPLQISQGTTRTLLMLRQSLKMRCQSSAHVWPKCCGYSSASRAAHAARCSCDSPSQARDMLNISCRLACFAGCAYLAGGDRPLGWKTSLSLTYEASKRTENLHARLELVAASGNWGSNFRESLHASMSGRDSRHGVRVRRCRLKNMELGHAPGCAVGYVAVSEQRLAETRSGGCAGWQGTWICHCNRSLVCCP